MNRTNRALPKNPHGFMVSPDTAFKPISLLAQEQIALFFASDGAEIIRPDPRLFEEPIVLPLPEALSFIPWRERSAN